MAINVKKIKSLRPIRKRLDDVEYDLRNRYRGAHDVYWAGTDKWRESKHGQRYFARLTDFKNACDALGLSLAYLHRVNAKDVK
jgi:hypothetical protein